MTNAKNIYTVVNKDIGQNATGYMINAVFNDSAKQSLSVIQENLYGAFPDAVWIAPSESLHITLLDCIAPLVDYSDDKTALFNKHRDTYDKALQESLRGVPPIQLEFDTIIATPTAIIIKASTDDAFNDIRREFTNRVQLLEGTKQPPTITHSTIARYTKTIPLEAVDTFVKKQKIDCQVTVDKFRLVRETVIPQLDYELLKEYPLNG